MFATKSVTSLRQTRLCRSNGIWSVTMHVESRRQSPGQVHDKVADTNHGSRRRDLCRGLSWFVSTTLSRTCPGLCRKVCVMEFGLKPTHAVAHFDSADILRYCRFIVQEKNLVAVLLDACRATCQ